MSGQNEFCANCRFFYPMGEGVGECVRFPPNMQNSNRERGIADYFPRVDASWWCGEWRGMTHGDETDMSDGHGHKDEEIA